MKSFFTIPGIPVAKPRMTRRDKWAKRPCVVRYFEWCDVARRAAKKRSETPSKLTIVFYLPLPSNAKKRGILPGDWHRAKPDIDNLCKSVMDSLWEDDSRIYSIAAAKMYDDGRGPRVELWVEG